MLFNPLKTRPIPLLLVLAGFTPFHVPAQTPPPPEILVESAVCLDTDGTERGNEPCEMGDTLALRVRNLDAWTAANPRNNPRRLVLLLDGRLLKGQYARVLRAPQPEPEQPGAATPPPSQDAAGGAQDSAPPTATPPAPRHEIRVDLIRVPGSDENRQAWREILRQSWFGSIRTVTAAIGLEDNPVSYGAQTLHLRAASRGTFIALTIFYAVVLVLFCYMAWKSRIIRESASGPVPDATKLRYSLGRSQMAWWLFLVVGGYLYIFAVTGDYSTLTTGVLTLMGISAATGLGAVVVDSSNKTGIESKRTELEAEHAKLAQQIQALEANPSPTPTEAALLAEMKVRAAKMDADLKALPRTEWESSGWWLQDIVQDQNGVSFHRFQIAVWTLVLGIVFIRSVYVDLTMPDFDATLLTLMGISSGTYIGFKLPGSTGA